MHRTSRVGDRVRSWCLPPNESGRTVREVPCPRRRSALDKHRTKEGGPMKKAALAVAIGAIALMLVGCGNKSDNKTKTESAPSTVKVRAGVSDPNDRNIAALAFLPAAVTV